MLPSLLLLRSCHRRLLRILLHSRKSDLDREEIDILLHLNLRLRGMKDIHLKWQQYRSKRIVGGESSTISLLVFFVSEATYTRLPSILPFFVNIFPSRIANLYCKRVWPVGSIYANARD